MEQIDWSMVQYHALWLAIAYVLTPPIARNRERIARSAGRRTFPRIAITRCGLSSVATRVLEDQTAQAWLIEGTISRTLETVIGGLVEAERERGPSAASA